MNFNFERILFYAILVTGLIYLIDLMVFAPRRKRLATNAQNKANMPLIIDYARSFFPVLLLVFLLRAFLYEPFRIPTGSLEPSLLIGDFILVNKFEYGLRLPIIRHKLIENQLPQRGDIVVFRWPPNPDIDFIKRVVGVPGDRIAYINKTLYVNGIKIPQVNVDHESNPSQLDTLWPRVEKKENLLGIDHSIYLNVLKSSADYRDIIVPDGMYFMMGDNRDDSADSRYWGFVPESHIVGKAVRVWMSWDSEQFTVRWNRIFKQVH